MFRGYRLWFDVGIKRYTTAPHRTHRKQWLWFDVGIKRYTTDFFLTSSLKKHVFYNLLINNILYLCVT